MLVPLLAAALLTGAPAGCTQRYVFFDVSDISLDERVSAHWSYDFEGETLDEPDRIQATLDTVATGSVRFHQPRPSRQRQIASFVELGPGCRIPNFRQGEIRGRDGMAYALRGSWTAGAQSGTCESAQTRVRGVIGQFVRRTTKPDEKTVLLKWIMVGPPALDCPFTGFEPDTGEYRADRHLRAYRFKYASTAAPIAKSVLLRARVIRLPVDITDTRESGTPWRDGTVTRTLRMTGSVTLRRYKACTITPATDIRTTTCGLP